MGLAVAVTSFLVILPAELPDKTVIACLVLSSRSRPLYVFAGAAVALAAQVVLAVAAGGALGLLPRRAVEAGAAAAFIIGAVLLFRHRGEDDAPASSASGRIGFLPVVATSFAVVFLAEFGDLTQFMTVSLAARYHDPIGVGVGAVLALWVASGVAVIVGWRLLKYIPVAWLTRGAALVMLALAGTSAAAAAS